MTPGFRLKADNDTKEPRNQSNLQTNPAAHQESHIDHKPAQQKRQI